MDINLKYYTGYDKTPAKIAREVFSEVFRSKGLEDKAPTLSVVAKKPTDKVNYRVVANEAVKEYLSWERDKGGILIRKPRSYVTRDCAYLRKTLPQLIHDKTSRDGLDFDQSVGIDDPFDAYKMSLLELYRPIKVERKVPQTHEEWMEEHVFKPRREKAFGTVRNPDTI